MKFTDRALKALPPPAAGKRDYIKFDSECRGLGYRVGPNSGTFIFQKLTPHGKVRIPLGHYPTMTIEAARKAVRALIARLDNGEDIGAGHRANRRQRKAVAGGEAITLETATEGYIAANPRKAKEGYLKRVRANMCRVFEPVYTRPLASLSFEADLQPCWQAIGQRGAAPVIRRQASAVLNWTARKHKIANPFVGHEEELPEAPPPRQVSLKLAEVKKVFAATDALDDPPAAALIQVLILTGLRRGEAANLKWRDLDDPDRPGSLTLPAEAMKGGRKARPHYVPLSPQAATIIRRQPRHVGSEYVFTRRGKIPITDYSDIKRKLDKALAGAGLAQWVVHDFRKSLTMWSMEHGEDFHFNVADVVDKALAHEPHRGIRGVYNMYEYKKERRILLTAWANAIVTPEVNDNAEPEKLPALSASAAASESDVVVPVLERMCDLFLLVAGNEGVAITVRSIWRRPERDYTEKFLETVTDRKQAASVVIQFLYDQAVKLALRMVEHLRQGGTQFTKLDHVRAVQKVLFELLKGIFVQPAPQVATVFAKAVVDAAITRWQLRDRRASGSNQEPSVETVTPVRTAA
jgi:integrase